MGSTSRNHGWRFSSVYRLGLKDTTDLLAKYKDDPAAAAVLGGAFNKSLEDDFYRDIDDPIDQEAVAVVEGPVAIGPE
jgi:hypothetical protein